MLGIGLFLLLDGANTDNGLELVYKLWRLVDGEYEKLPREAQLNTFTGCFYFNGHRLHFPAMS